MTLIAKTIIFISLMILMVAYVIPDSEKQQWYFMGFLFIVCVPILLIMFTKKLDWLMGKK